MSRCRLEFRYAPWNHFGFSAVCLVMCMVGVSLTRGTNLEGQFPYFAFAGILGGMHFLLMIMAFVFNDKAKHNAKAEEIAGVMWWYRLLLFGMAVISIAGGILTGTHGFCLRGEPTANIATTTTTAASQTASTGKPEANEGGPCYFYENYEANLATAICIAVLCCLSFFNASILVMKSVKAERKAKPKPKSQTKPAPKAEQTEPKTPTESPKVIPAKSEAPKVTPDKTAPNTTVTANIVVNTIGADTKRTDSYTLQTEEEDALRLLKLHQAQESLMNTKMGTDSGGFNENGVPSYPANSIPPPPPYETTVPGAYPANGSLQLDVQEPGNPQPRSQSMEITTVVRPNFVNEHSV